MWSSPYQSNWWISDHRRRCGLYLWGTDAADNSGSLNYVRLEFGGIAFVVNSEINGLTMGGVGSGTTIDHVQVSYSGDDSFEWFGGTVNAKHLIAFRGWDDDFDTDYGYSGMVQYAVSLRDPAIADQSSSNSFESDNDATGSTNAPFTSAIFSNVSSFGPLATPSVSINSLYKRAMHIRRSSKLQLFNSIFAGWPTGVYVDGNTTQANAIANELKLRYSVLAGMTTNIDVPATQTWDKAAATAWYQTADFKNVEYVTNAELGIVDPFNLTAPKFNLTAESVLNTKSSWYIPSDLLTPSDQKKLTLYTNPGTSEVSLILPSEQLGTLSISVVDLTGRLVYHKQTKASEVESIPVGNLSKGVYLVVVQQGEVRLSQKFVVNN